MKNTKTSKQVKHEHAVVVCSIIGRKGSCSYVPLPIKDKNGNSLDFINIRDTFLSEEHLIISKKEKTVYFRIRVNEYEEWKKSIGEKSKPLDEWKPNESEYVSECDVLGEYDWEHRRVFLYTKNIENLCNKSTNKTDEHKEKKYIVETYIHELFHAFFHSVTLQGNNNYNYIPEIEEALTEFCTLYFLKEMKPFNSYKKLKGIFNFDENEMLKFALQDIKSKQDSLGPLAAYGFGAYLFENLEEKEQYKLINNYIQKLGYIDKDDDKVKEYCRKVRLSKFVPGNQEHCLELLKEILKPTAK